MQWPACARKCPVVSVTRFDDVDQAVAWANDNDHGLASSVWTSDIAKGMATALHVDQHALHAGERDAARRAEVLRLRQGPLHLSARGLHHRATCDGKAVRRLVSCGQKTCT